MPFTLDGERPGIRLQPPRIGEHGHELLKEVGYSDEDIAALQARHITLGD